jgi:phage shock protein C
VDHQKRLYRSTQDRMFAGVCGGIAEYLDVDPTLVRLVFAALTLMGGPGIIIYIVLMLVVPEEPDKRLKEKRHGYTNTYFHEDTDDMPDHDAPSIIRSSTPVEPDDIQPPAE